MSAALLDDLLAAYVAPARLAEVAPTPAKAAKAANREHSCGLVADSMLCEGLRIPAKAKPGVTGAELDSQTFAAVRKPRNGPQSEETCGSSQDSQDSQGCARTCAAGDPDALAAVAWTDADIARFLDRRARLMRWGWGEGKAEALAERLVHRDRDGDTRRLCVECANFRAGRCRQAERAGVGGPEVGALALVLQHCPAFGPIEGER